MSDSFDELIDIVGTMVAYRNNEKQLVEYKRAVKELERIKEPVYHPDFVISPVHSRLAEAANIDNATAYYAMDALLKNPPETIREQLQELFFTLRFLNPEIDENVEKARQARIVAHKTNVDNYHKRKKDLTEIVERGPILVEPEKSQHQFALAKERWYTLVDIFGVIFINRTSLLSLEHRHKALVASIVGNSKLFTISDDVICYVPTDSNNPLTDPNKIIDLVREFSISHIEGICRTLGVLTDPSVTNFGQVMSYRFNSPKVMNCARLMDMY